MAVPTLTPESTTSAIVLPSTGSVDNVNSSDNPLPFGIYTATDVDSTSITNFKQGAADQVAYVYKKLGGDVLDIEITQYQVYSAYEEAVLEYSYIVNLHQAQNVLSDVLGGTTGSFDMDGKLITDDGDNLTRVAPGTNVELRYPKIRFDFARRFAAGAASAAGFGGHETIYSASIDVTTDQQDYDLQSLISSSAADNSSFPFSNENLGANEIGNKAILVRKVYYKTPHAMWRFFGYYGGLNTVGNLANYGQYADDTTWELIPAWQNKLQAQAFEDSIYTRMSHYSYEIKNNNLRVFPIPSTDRIKKFWIEFTVQSDAWSDESDRQTGTRGINNMNTLPFENIPYGSINSMGKQWIRRFCLSLCKEMLGQVRSKFSTIPIPGESLQMNGSDLLAQAKEEQEKLREELKTTLSEMTYLKIAEDDAATADATGKIMQTVPNPIFVG